MTEHSSVYAAYAERKSKLAELLNASGEAVKILEMKSCEDSLRALGGKLNHDTLKVLIVGSFKNGKSTFINSLLGDEILPAYATPCTAVINEVKYGTGKRAMLHFRDPLPEKIPASAPAKVRALLSGRQAGQIPPLEIPYDEIEDYAVIPMGGDASEMLTESPYERIELFWPLELLENSVEIIDSPGLNEHRVRSQVTMEYLTKADAILMVFTVNALCSESEMQFIERNLKDQGFEDIFFVVNRFDTIRSDREKQRVKDYAKSRLAGLTSFGEDGIYFVSALNALDGKMGHNPALYASSGMGEFEGVLAEFLVNQRGRIKLQQPSTYLKWLLSQSVLKTEIPRQRRMLDSSLEEIRHRYEVAKPRLGNLIERKNVTQKGIEVDINEMMSRVRHCIYAFYENLNPMIATWAEEYYFKSNIPKFPNKDNVQPLVHELTEFLQEKIEAEQQAWQDNTLFPLIEDNVTCIVRAMERPLDDFFVEIDKVKVSISGDDTVSADPIPLWQRAVAAGGGFLIGDLGLAALGGMTGLTKEFAVGAAIQIGALTALSFIGLLNPVTFIAVVGFSLVRAFLGTGDATARKVKEQVAEGIQEKISDIVPGAVDGIAGMIYDKISEVGNSVIASMDAEIDEINSQVTSIIRELEGGQASVDRRKAEIAGCERKVEGIIAELDKLSARDEAVLTPEAAAEK